MYKITLLQLLVIWISGITGWLWIIELEWGYPDNGLRYLAHYELINYFFLAKFSTWFIPSALVFYTLGWLVRNKKVMHNKHNN